MTCDHGHVLHQFLTPLILVKNHFLNLKTYLCLQHSFLDFQYNKTIWAHVFSGRDVHKQTIVRLQKYRPSKTEVERKTRFGSKKQCQGSRSELRSESDETYLRLLWRFFPLILAFCYQQTWKILHRTQKLRDNQEKLRLKNKCQKMSKKVHKNYKERQLQRLLKKYFFLKEKDHEQWSFLSLFLRLNSIKREALNLCIILLF